MTKHRNQTRSNLLDRCLRDVKTGRLWLSAADRKKYQSPFGELGVKVSKPFANEETLLNAWCHSLTPEHGIVLYELARLADPSLPPLVTDLDRWPKAQREEYLLLRIRAKLHHLFEAKEVIRAWLTAYLRNHHEPREGIDDSDGTAIADLDRVLTEMIGKRTGTADDS